mmetsp:Transcript_18970/g.44926  ORF Transcript_18970/g.44926 Transcript_18970/m.44926 type:complete len:233 (-) Transcript_18970:194-892(-)
MAQHTCPLLPKAPANTFGATSCTSTSDRIIAASLPPSSRVMRLTSPAHFLMMDLPVATDPVKETLATWGCPVRNAPTLKEAPSSPLRQLYTPGGRQSLSLISSASRRLVRGVNGLGLCTTVLPRTIAGAHFCTEQKRGKFHGVMHATTPIGTLRTSTLRSSVSLYTSGSLTMAAAFWSRKEQPATSPLAAARGLPCSRTSSSASSSAWACKISSTFRMAALRSAMGTDLQVR